MLFTPLFHTIRLRQRGHKAVRRTRSRLRTVHVRSPPRTGRPPHRTLPDIRILAHVRQPTGEGLLAETVDATSKLADEAHLAIRPQPARGGRERVRQRRRVVARRRGAAEVAVEVLVHLVDELVLRVGESAHGGAVVAGAVVLGP